LLLTLIVVNPIPVTTIKMHNKDTVRYHVNAFNLTRSRSININVVFVNYNASLIDLDILLGVVKKKYLEYLSYSNIEYQFNLNVSFSNQEFWLDLKSFIDSIKFLSNTSDLLESVLEEHRDLILSGEIGARKRIFVNNVSGYAIDAVKVEKWLANKSLNLENNYYIYFLNLSYLDNHELKREHWFFVNEFDVDSNVSRTFWRLEWDNDLNKNVSFPFSAFTHRTRIVFIDPTSYNWYLAWTRIWWGGILNTSFNGRYFFDLDHYIRSLNLSDPISVRKISNYLGGWLNDFIGNLFGDVMSYSLSGGPFFSRNISVQVILFNEAENVVSLEDLKWTLHRSYITKAFLDLYPMFNIDIEFRFYNLSSVSEIVEKLDESLIPQYSSEHWKYYDGNYLFNSLYSLRSKYFDLDRAEKVLTAWIFVLYNGSMIVGNREFTGLGGVGNVMIMMSLDRIMGSHFDKPRRGFTRIIVHELGHAIGALHTFDSYSYASDFTYDVMGYYPYAWNFSKIRKDMMLKAFADDRLDIYGIAYNSLLNRIDLEKATPRVLSVINKVYNLLTEVDELVNKTLYFEANTLLDEVYDYLLYLDRVLSDNEPPVIEVISPKDGSVVDSNVTTLVLNVVDNIEFFKIEVFVNDVLIYEGNETNVQITLKEGANEIRIIAFDVANNSNELTIIVYYGTKPPKESNSAIVLAISILVVATLIILVLYLKRRK